MGKTYTVTIQDVSGAESPRAALAAFLERVRGEETVASVECESTGEVFHFEIHTGQRLDFEEE